MKCEKEFSIDKICSQVERGRIEGELTIDGNNKLYYYTNIDISVLTNVLRGRTSIASLRIANTLIDDSGILILDSFLRSGLSSIKYLYLDYNLCIGEPGMAILQALQTDGYIKNCPYTRALNDAYIACSSDDEDDRSLYNGRN